MNRRSKKQRRERKFFKPGTRCAVLMDFDGTVTELDVVDALLVQFAENRDWIAYEKEWVSGRISSRECLQKQLGLVRVSGGDLDRFLRNIRLDAGFVPFLKFLRGKRIPFTLLSDGFDLFIRKILQFQKMGQVPFKSNALRHRRNRLVASFPHFSGACPRCAHCKRETIDAYRESVGHFVFIGDGLSDQCAAEAADTVFAKGSLAEFCRATARPFISYETFDDILRSFPEILGSSRKASDERIVCKY